VSGNSSDFLKRIAIELRREIIAIDRMDCALVVRDIAARRREAGLGRRRAAMRARIQKELERQGRSEADWCKQELGCSIQTMHRRRQLAKGWVLYERRRVEAGNTGQCGILYGLSLIGSEHRPYATNSHHMRIRSPTDAPKLDLSRCDFITGDARIELRKMRSESVNVVICSPPYWPTKRAYGGRGIGYEPTLQDYVSNLVAIFHEGRRVLKDTGVLWLVVGDSYSTGGGRFKQDGYKENRPSQKQLMPKGEAYQAGDRSPGNLLLIPERLAMGLQDDGLVLRQKIIWDKGWVRPESAKDRVTQTYDTVLMFAKGKGYYYDQDPLREPVVKPYAAPDRQKPGLMRREANRDLRVISNPMGRNSGSVWRINSGNYKGKHTATFPPELVRRMIASTCDDNSLVLDPFGGAGTTAMVTLQLGHRAITIDMNGDYTREARERLADAAAFFSMSGADQADDGSANRISSESEFTEGPEAALAAD
jgi:site-specific DNA-methyltransferase (cytosine-N4-specific)